MAKYKYKYKYKSVSIGEEWNVTCFQPNNSLCLYLSSSELPQASARRRGAAEKVLKDLGIQGVLNMSSDSRTRAVYQQWYQQMGIELFEMPIEDAGGPVSHQLLDNIVSLHNELGNDYRLLVHCTMGINRSALACGAILWNSQLDGNQMKWQSPEKMIDWMRKRQREDRRISSLLANSWFEFGLRQWCHSH